MSNDLDLVGKLRKALEPFAALKKHLQHFPDPDDLEPCIEVEVSYRDIRRAAEALAIPVTGGGEVVDEARKEYVLVRPEVSPEQAERDELRLQQAFRDAPPQDTSDSSALPPHLAELSAKATPGPWATDENELGDITGYLMPNEFRPIVHCSGAFSEWWDNREFIVAAVNYVRSLESKSQYGSGTPKTSTPEAEWRDWLTEQLKHAFVAGCEAVQENYQEDADPEFSEAGYDYAHATLAEAIAAAPTPPAVTQEWQPIETVPKKEGEWLIVSPTGKTAFVAAWGEEDQRWFSFNLTYENRAFDPGVEHRLEPKYWIPFPSLLGAHHDAS